MTDPVFYILISFGRTLIAVSCWLFSSTANSSTSMYSVPYFNFIHILIDLIVRKQQKINDQISVTKHKTTYSIYNKGSKNIQKLIIANCQNHFISQNPKHPTPLCITENMPHEQKQLQRNEKNNSKSFIHVKVVIMILPH